MNEFIEFILNISIWGVAKVLVLIALAIYLVFAFVVVRQVSMMIKVISGSIDLPLKILAWLHFIFAVLVILLAIFLL